MSTLRNPGIAAVLLIASFASLLSSSVRAAPAADDPAIDAIWKSQQLNFVYRGYSTLYSCSSLERKLRKILTSVGARDDLQLRSYSCDDQSSIATFQVALASPVEASAENLSAATSYNTRDELTARVRGDALVTAQDIVRFPAAWQTVSFARDRRLRLEPGDCELVRELRRQILPRMSVRIVRDNVRCSPAFGNIGAPRLTVSALVPQ